MEMEHQTTTSKFRVYPNQCHKNDEKLYLDAQNADVHFTFGAAGYSRKRVPANKTILAAENDVFKAMFTGESNKHSDIHVPDSTEAAFMEFLQYFYLSEVKLTADNIVGVLHLGTKYGVKKCVDDCFHFLMDTLNDENVCAHFDVAIRYDQKQLIDLCEKRIIINAEAVFGSGGFLECDKKVLGHILKMDVLPCAEDEVFKACMSWVKAKIGGADLTIELVDQHLGDLYYDIRLASLTLDQLCALQKQYESVLSSDFITITKMIVQPQLHAPKFQTVPRHAKWNENASIECDCIAYDDDDDNYRPLMTTEVTTFSVNKPVFLGKLWCTTIPYGKCEEHPEKWSTELKIIEASGESIDAYSKILTTMKFQCESDDATVISLPHAVLIRPGFYYQIRIGPFPEEHDCYSMHLAKEVQLESDIKIEFHKNCNSQLTVLLRMFINKIE